MVKHLGETLKAQLPPFQVSGTYFWILDAYNLKQLFTVSCGKPISLPPPPALMCSCESDRVRDISRPSGSVGLCRMSCMAFLRPVLPEAMKSAYVASTSAIVRASFTQQHLQEDEWDVQLQMMICAYHRLRCWKDGTGLTLRLSYLRSTVLT